MVYKKYLNLILGLLIVAFDFNAFLLPNNFTAIGTSGLSVIFNKSYQIDTGLFVLIANIILLLISYLFLGKKATFNSLIGSLLMPVFMKLTEYLIPFLDINNIEPVVSAIIGGILSGIGYGLIFKEGFTSGGTDILDQIVTKYYHIPIGSSVLLVDGLIVIAGGLVFGIETFIYSLIILILIGKFSTEKSIGLKEDKILYIQTKKIKEITAYLINNYQFGLSILNTVGGFKKNNNKMIICSVSNSYYYEIKESIKLLDPDAFIIITDSYDTIYKKKISRQKNK